MELRIWIDDNVKRSDEDETDLLTQVGDFVREHFYHPFDPNKDRVTLEFEVTE